MNFFDLVKAIAEAAKPSSKRYLYKIPKQSGGFKYVYAGQPFGKRAKTGKKGAGGGKGAMPPVDDSLSAVPFSGDTFDASAFASLGKVVATSSNRKVVRDRFGTLWGMKDGHLVRL